MTIEDLKPEQVLKYFEVRLKGQRLRKAGAGYVARCCFHDDKDPSLSINTAKAVWRCHTGCGFGGLTDFEMKFSGCDRATAFSVISEIIGIPQTFISGPKWEFCFDYTDEYGKLIFQVLRYPKDPVTGKKRISARQLKGEEWKWDTEKCRMVLYRLPEVITARELLVFEGEKKVDLVRKDLQMVDGVAATTCPFGAGKWRDEFAPYMAGKKVIIFPDMNAIKTDKNVSTWNAGEKHALAVAHSVYRYAAGVKIVNLPGLQPKQDVVDWYALGKTFADLVEEVNKTPWWKPPEVVESCLISVRDFIKDAPREVNWILEGIIEKGSNGVISARPKAGKSFTILDMAIALASGQSWMPGNGLGGFHIESPVRTAYVSREDNAHTTQWRTVQILGNRMINIDDIAEYLHLNTRMQSPQMKLDDPDLLGKLLRDLEQVKAEFLILDVFRKLHDAEENDNTEMQKIMDIVISIQERVGCQICLVHHDNKREDATLTERLRGASAIAGFAEWVLGMKVVNPEAPKHEWVREMEVEIKAALPPDNFHFQIKDAVPPKTGICLERVFWEPPKKNRSKKADQLASTGQQSFPVDPRDEDIPF